MVERKSLDEIIVPALYHIDGLTSNISRNMLEKMTGKSAECYTGDIKSCIENLYFSTVKKRVYAINMEFHCQYTKFLLQKSQAFL